MTHSAKSFAIAGIVTTILVANPQVASSQEQDTIALKPARLTLTDGSELVGTITGEDSVSIFFKTAGNLPVTVPKNQVESRELLSGQAASLSPKKRIPKETRTTFVQRKKILT
jgi:hypothetical protein